jgi:hypothetical protein
VTDDLAPVGRLLGLAGRVAIVTGSPDPDFVTPKGEWEKRGDPTEPVADLQERAV